jgi:adenylate cyclase
MVPGDEEEHYDDYVMTLYAQGVLTPNEWLDLGGPARFPPKSTLAPACGSCTKVSTPRIKRC